MRRAPAALCGLCLLSGCFQEIDSGASGAATSTTLTGPPMHTVDLMTPPIGFGDAQETDDACAATSFHATAILRAACAPCHGGGPGQNLGQPPFDYVLDVAKLLAASSSTVKDPVTMQPVRFVVPGDPDHSRLYVRMFRREMPPGDVVGLPPNPNRPSVSDVSVIRQWIGHCLGKDARDGQGQGGDVGQGQSTPPASPDAAAAPAGEADAAAAADRDAPARADSGGGAGTPADGGAIDGPRRRDGGAGGRGGG